MFRQIIRLRHNLTRVSDSITIRYKLPIYGSTYHLTNRKFSSEMTADWPDSIKKFLARENISEPTKIQEKTLQIAMANKDLVGVARTGSGKTLAFAIPAIMKILKERENKQTKTPDDGRGRKEAILPTCLVLAPTRELATQTSNLFSKFSGLKINSLALVGGASRGDQLRQLSYKDQEIYIATPGRLIDLMDSGMVDLSSIKYVVLDEADRMLDMGFEPQIRRIMSMIPRQRQTLMWSATWPKEIQNLAKEFMNDYEYVAIDSEKLKANPNIKQIIQVCTPHQKLRLLITRLEEFKAEKKSRILIFVNMKRTADDIHLQLMRNKFRAVVMHGDRSQSQRDGALELFKNGTCDILIATDVAARGLDINDINYVINYDFPATIEDYVHRIGRTARHEKDGTSISFVTEGDANLVGKLTKVLEETNQEVPQELSSLVDMAPMYRKPDRRTRVRDDFYTRGGGGDYQDRDRYRSRSSDRDDHRDRSRGGFRSGSLGRSFSQDDYREAPSGRNDYRDRTRRNRFEHEEDNANEDFDDYQDHGRRNSFRSRENDTQRKNIFEDYS